MIDQNHLDLLLELNTDDSQHSGGALIDHLRGTHDFLHEWGNEQAVCLAGLFHSIYGTQSYETESASLEDRQRIRDQIGEKAERLAFLFSVSIRSGFFDALGKQGATLWDRVHEVNIPVAQDDLRYLIEMEAANYLEFMPKSPFTVNELNTFEAKIERGRELLTAPAYDAIKAGIESRRKEISSSREE